MSPEGPNVLLIQADQLRWDCLGAAGHPDVRTPNLDRLAADGVRYRNAFCTAPVCTPSRYSLLSGLAVHQHGGWTNRSTLAPTLDTFPKALRRAGYGTAAVGKMHLSPTYLDVGYDHMMLAEQDGPGRYDDDYHRGLRAAGQRPLVDLQDQEAAVRPTAPPSYWSTFGVGRSDLPEEWHSTTWIGERAVEEVGRWAAGDRRLLHVSFVKPHHPFDPPAPWDELYDPASLALPPGWTDEIPDADAPHRHGYFDFGPLDEAALRAVLAHYYATITHVDHQIGRILDRLRDAGLYDDTLIVFTSDHGEFLGFHHLLLKWGPLYDPVAKVPLLVKLPADRARRGEVDDALVSLVDVAPTILSACGLATDAALPGTDLTAGTSAREWVITEALHAGEVAYMVRSTDHKLLVHPDGARDALFELASDPLELVNRISDPGCRSVVEEARAALLRWLAFDTVTPNHLDLDARQIDAPNVPPQDGTRRDEHRRYFLGDHAAAAPH